MDEVKLMTQAGEKVGYAVGTGMKAVRESAAAAGKAGAGVTRRAARQAEHRMMPDRNGRPRRGGHRGRDHRASDMDIEILSRRARRRIARDGKRMAKQARRLARQTPELMIQTRPRRRRGRFLMLLTVLAGVAGIAAYLSRSRRRVDGMRLAEEPTPRYEGRDPEYREDDDPNRIPRLREARLDGQRSPTHQR